MMYTEYTPTFYIMQYSAYYIVYTLLGTVQRIVCAIKYALMEY